jgi:hypothetical protein
MYIASVAKLYASMQIHHRCKLFTKVDEGTLTQLLSFRYQHPSTRIKDERAKMSKDSTTALQHFLPSRRSTSTHYFIRIVYRLNLLGRGRHLILRNAPLPLLVSSDLSKRHMALVVGVHISEVKCRTEILALPSFANNAVKLIDLFKGKSLSLVDHEPAGSC